MKEEVFVPTAQDLADFEIAWWQTHEIRDGGKDED